MTEERQEQFIKTYLRVAKEVSLLSRCKRKQVGSIVVKDGNILGFGYNGTPAGEDNCCEENNITKPNVLHAEHNVIKKIDENDVRGSVLFVTLTPCKKCAELIIESGITEVFYSEDYRCSKGVEHLKNNNIKVRKVDINDNNICNKA